ncbi:non-reducing end alpha-L-arabinofuranosidase family hydrolase [Sorangium cellulosum]|uniref:non-reducing end alpha-L-arabinofuranosidase family hydrolase n=1 Tax=Sorangium cellulosum TaxID=56 RepID=UPI001F16B0BC|nr:non-reducing end alpha-L-arabinofuranosidase family hydrolase [Sorangium cellulosum]
MLAALAGCGSDPADGQQPAAGTGGTENPTGASGTTGTGGAGTGGSIIPGGSGGGGTGPGGDTTTGSGGAPAAGSGGGGGSPVTCDLPTTFRWKSGPPVISPKPPAGRTFASVKDPTIVFHDGKHHVFATVFDTTSGNGSWQSVYLNFTDFSQANAAEQHYMSSWATGSTVAPQAFYFRPHNKWYLIYQWNGRYSTNDDINNMNGWSRPQPLLRGEPGAMGSTLGALDFWVICDDDNCHLFFSRDDGKLYRSKVSIDDFPNFDGYEVVMEAPSAGLLFEASNVYKVDGSNKYLLLVEAFDNSPRFFRSWTSESLDGPWAPLADTKANPFAGPANVTFDGADWTDDISHGELIRSGNDERMTINACNMQFLYQGRDPSVGGDYGRLPYKLGLLTLEE